MYVNSLIQASVDHLQSQGPESFHDGTPLLQSYSAFGPKGVFLVSSDCNRTDFKKV